MLAAMCAGIRLAEAFRQAENVAPEVTVAGRTPPEDEPHGDDNKRQTPQARRDECRKKGSRPFHGHQGDQEHQQREYRELCKIEQFPMFVGHLKLRLGLPTRAYPACIYGLHPVPIVVVLLVKPETSNPTPPA